MKLISENKNIQLYYYDGEEYESPVVIKVLNDNSNNFILKTLLDNEYNITSISDSPYIRKAIKKITLYNKPSLVLEYFNGINLTEFFKDKTSARDFLMVAINITKALSAIHEKNIIHKNLNPQNILINDKLEIKITGFEYASKIDQEINLNSKNEHIQGEPLYISPEQTGRTNRIVDLRSDLYSLGVSLYEIIAGKLPFTGSDILEIISAHIAKTPLSPYETIKEKNKLTKNISDIIMKLLSKNPEERYQSATGLLHDLEFCNINIENPDNLDKFILGKYDISTNFKLSQKIFGRDNELSFLLNKIKRTIDSKSAKLILINGEPGVGKTFLINELNNILQKEKIFLSFGGKYEQFNQSEPYYFFLRTINNFISHILTESYQELENWKSNILNITGIYGKILTDVIPKLELIIGEQPEVNSLGNIEDQNRFNHFFISLIQEFCQKENPLLIFVDDLQWADSASLKILQLLLENHETKNIIIVATYRKNEYSTFQFMKLLEAFENKKESVEFLEITNLNKSDILKLVGDSLLYYSNTYLDEFSEIIFQKTQGNPFFVNQFLSSLSDEKLLYFSNHEKIWKWDIERIRTIKVTDNVVELLTAKLNSLSKEVLEILQFSACLGNKFDTQLLSVISEKDPSYIEKYLYFAIQSGIVCDLYKYYQFEKNYNTNSFQFLHDQVLQAVYSTIDSAKLKKIHLKIARILFQKYKNNENTSLFDVVNHFNIAKDLIDKDDEKNVIADINLQIALKAKKANAYEDVNNFTKKGISFLSIDSWNTAYQLTFDLYILLVETESLIGNYDKADELYKIILSNCQKELDKSKLYYLQLTHYAQQLRYSEATEIIIDNLRILGFNIPKTKVAQNILILNLFVSIKLKLKGKKISSLADLPQMTNQQALLLSNILGTSLDIIYASGKKPIMAIIILKIINLAVEYGNTEMTTLAYAFYANLIQIIFRDYKTSKEFGFLALELSKRYNNPILKCKIYTATSIFLGHFYEHINFSINNLKKGFDLVLESGNPLYANYNVYYICLHKLISGANLNELNKEVSNSTSFLKKINNSMRIDVINNLITYAIQELKGIKENNFSESEQNLFIEKNKDSQILFNTFFYIKTKIFYFNEEFEKALSVIDKHPELLNFEIGLLVNTDTLFYSILVLLKFFNIFKQNKNKNYLSKINEIRTKIKKWSELCPENYLHKHFLVEAEYNFATNNYHLCANLYEKAINSAKKNSFNHIYSLALKLAGEFYLNQDMERIGYLYIKQAYEGYMEWGATVLAENLLRKYHLSANELSVINNKNLDSISLIKASQFISSEIDLKKLVENLLFIVKENAGAEKVALILPENDEWYIESLLENDIFSKRESLEISSNISKRIVHYVLRTHQTILINDATNDEHFTHDAYLLNIKPKSLLCLPIMNKGTISGILYLENNLTIGAFTEEHLNMLNILSSQLVISLENANLYTMIKNQNLNLEKKVAERTATLQDINEIQKGMIQTIVHDLKNPLSNIIMFSKHLETKSLSEERIKKTSGLIHNSSRHMAKMVENLLEITKIEEGKIEPEFETFDIVAVLKETIIDFHEMAKQKEIKLNLSLKAQASLINADKTRTKQVLENLISNALKFSPENKSIYINFNELSDKIIIEIKDEGPGLTEKDKELLFKKFSRLSAQPTRGEHTTGLGLSIVKKLMEVMGGNVWCESEAGKGASFFISFKISSDCKID